jgi:hypothetical protein
VDRPKSTLEFAIAEVGRTVRAALQSWARTARLVLLILVLTAVVLLLTSISR